MSRDGVSDEALLMPDGKDTLNWLRGDGKAMKSTQGNGNVSGQVRVPQEAQKNKVSHTGFPPKYSTATVICLWHEFIRNVLWL